MYSIFLYTAHYTGKGYQTVNEAIDDIRRILIFAAMSVAVSYTGICLPNINEQYFIRPHISVITMYFLI